MKSWRYASFLLAIAFTAPVYPAQRNTAAPREDAPKRVNETTLAGLRPGRDALTSAFKRYKEKYLVSKTSSSSKEWRDTCTGHSLALELDSRAVIQRVTVSLLVPHDGNCDNRRFEFLNLDDWVTGKGLRLGDSRNHVVEVYGEPNSSEPVVRGDADFELLEFDFGWAGADVPRTMQIYCDRDSGRVLEIVLSAGAQRETKRATNATESDCGMVSDFVMMKTEMPIGVMTSSASAARELR